MIAKNLLPRCWQRVSVALLLQICEFFWNLSKPAQDGLLWSIQSLNGPRATGDDPSDSGSDSSDDSSSNSRRQSHKTKWFLGDVQVCRRAFAKMLGIGQSRLQRTRHTFQGLDERTLPGQWMWEFTWHWLTWGSDKYIMATSGTLLIQSTIASNSERFCICFKLAAWGHRSKPAYATASVNAFMYKTYYSISETMPNRRGAALEALNLVSSGL